MAVDEQKHLISRVAANTEHVFNDAFWEAQNVITNALDNVPARLYVDQRCLYFAKPLLESDTLGTKLNTQVCSHLIISARFFSFCHLFRWFCPMSLCIMEVPLMLGSMSRTLVKN